MLELIKQGLQQIINNIDSGNSNITEEEGIKLLDYINRITNTQEKLSVYQACKFLGIGRSTFDLWVKEGKIPEGRKQQGFKEKFYLKEDLIKIKNTYE